MTYYLMFILYLFSTIEMMLDQKQIWVIFLFNFKMCPKAVETTHNINSAFGPGTANEHRVWWWFRSFGKEKGEMRSIVAGHQKLTAAN